MALAFVTRLLQALRFVKPKGRPPADVILGVAANRSSREKFAKLPASLRPQHLGIVGVSGTGKTHLIEHMVRQDIRNGVGFAIFDVHGDLADSVVAYLAERGPTSSETYARTVLLEPFDPDRTFAFNPLERNAYTSPFLQAQQFAYILRKRWQESAFGARTEELLRNCLYTLSANDQTLLELPRLLTDGRFRSHVTIALPSQEVRMYWQTRYSRMSPQMQGVMREPILTRVSAFLSDPQIRDIVGQNRSTFSFRDAIANGSWVVLNLSKGKLGENSSILGSLLFTKLELDVMGLAHVPPRARRLFVVYADEVQNLSSDSFEHLIAEARKYNVALVSGHQFWNQLDMTSRHAMLGVGSKAYFRLHYHDAVELAGELSAKDRNRYLNLLTTLDRGEAIVRTGNDRPVLINVPGHRNAKPSAGEIATLRVAVNQRCTRLRTDIHEELRNRGTGDISTLHRYQSFQTHP